MDKFLIKYLNTLYKKGNKLFRKDFLYDSFTQEQIDILGSFHAKEVYHVTLDDDYLCGIRADNFVIEYGWSEFDDLSYKNINANGEPYNQMFVITGNHKGARSITVLRENV